MLFIPFMLLVVALVRLDHAFTDKNHGFCLHHIFSSFKSPYQLQPAHFDSAIVEQPFRYLTKGHQTYAFMSDDHRYVLKFYRFPSHLRKHAWLTLPRSREKVAYNLQKLDASIASYKLAFEELQEECGLIAVNLPTASAFHKQVRIVDRLGAEYAIDLGATYFILQKSAQLLFPTLSEQLSNNDHNSAKQLIAGIIQLIKTRAEKGIVDKDAILEKNYGWLAEGRAIHIDVGRFAKEQCDSKQEVAKVTEPLKNWLMERSPELYAYYQAQLRAL